MNETYAKFNENDIRPDDLMDGVRQAYQQDVEWLLERREQFIEVTCPACDSEYYDYAFDKNEFNYQKCRDCQTVYISPRPSLSLISEFYENSKGYKYWAENIFPASETIRKEAIFKPRVNEVIELCDSLNVKNDLLIEVGAGFGTFSQSMQEAGYFKEVISIEPNNELAKRCVEKGLQVINSVVEDVELETNADVIVSFEVIEHLFSVNDFLRDCKNLLKDNGLAIFSCPNIQGFDNLTLGVNSSTIDHEHLNYFHPSSLKLLFEKHDFNVIKVTTPGKLDTDIVRKYAIDNPGFLAAQPFLKMVLIDQWDTLGDNFQRFLADNNLSGHMWIVAYKGD